MRKLFSRDPGVPDEVTARAGLVAGDKVLAAARARDDRWLLATRRSLVLVGPAETQVIGWERVESADWSRDDDRLRVAEVGEYGERRPVHEFLLGDPGTFLPVVRERVTASVVLQRRVAVRDGLGLFVVARRVPDTGEVTWAYEFDEGLEPSDPEVSRLADLGLQAAAEELGLR